ncbi:MAG TPA: sulfite exporter TauE/SafE family protein [Methylophilaceae bacterium]|nr:sulfite exporter TauE/SafE family protein [Methylophilaceae bacterium]
MQTSLAFTTFLMGFAGGPHCIVMCGAACVGIRQSAGGNSLLKFQLGRIAGYATLGAVAAFSVKNLAWVSDQSLALHPLWTFFHVLVLSWGLVLLAYARQPVWADNIGRKIWSHVRQFSNLPGGVFVTGMLWALMPCGLLYSALLVASLSGNPMNGAVSMASFAIGTTISLMLGPILWLKLKDGSKWINESRSMRVAGLLLTLAAAWAIWMDITHQLKIWCN